MSARTIGQVAKLLDINVETIRYYERQGLIEQPSRPPGGYRHYPEATVARIRFIRRAQQLGFSLKDIRQLLTLEDSPCGEVEALARTKLQKIREKIIDLKRLEQTLQQMIASCQTNPDKADCPLIDSLSGQR